MENAISDCIVGKPSSLASRDIRQNLLGPKGSKVMCPASPTLFWPTARAFSHVHTSFTAVSMLESIIEITRYHETEDGQADNGPYARYTPPESVRLREFVTMAAQCGLRAPYSWPDSGVVASGAQHRRLRNRTWRSRRPRCTPIRPRTDVRASPSFTDSPEPLCGSAAYQRPASRPAQMASAHVYAALV